MTDKKITQLPASTVPLAGTEVLPIVQGVTPTTKQVSVANLTAGRAISATQYTSTIPTGTPPLVVTSTTEVANLKAAAATLADSATLTNAVKSNATTGVLQVTGPAAGSTRVMTTPDADFTAARSDAGQTLTGNQRINGNIGVQTAANTTASTDVSIDLGGTNGSNFSGFISLTLAKGATWNGSNWIYTTSYADAKAYALSFSNGHIWYHANAGTPGAAVSFAQVGKLDNNGDFSISGSTATKASGTAWTNPSDIRLKQNVQDYTKGLNEVLQINPKTWEFNGKGNTVFGARGVGLIANEIEKILPESVDTYKAKLNSEDENETDIKRFDATEITWVLINAVKELTIRIEQLEKK